MVGVPRIQNWLSARRAVYGNIFPGAYGRGIGRHRQAAKSVRLLEPARRPPATPVEHQVAAWLEAESVIPFDELVQRVAAKLYAEELRHGAAALDIGLLGSRLFAGEIVAEVEAADGILWEIIPGKGAS